MKTRMLRDIEVSEVGMGCMAFSHGYGQIPAEKYSIEAIRNAYEHGCTFFDTAEVYSPNLSGIGHNELIVGKALKDVRENVVIATKLMLHGLGFGSVYKSVRSHLEGSLDRLQTDYVDIYYLHRMGGVSVEKVAEAMGRLIDDGLIRGWGLSQVDVDVIDRAQQVTPLAAIQNIYSMVERDSEAKIIPYCVENNIGFVPFSPLGKGFLTGTVKNDATFADNDIRHSIPRFMEQENMEHNQALAEAVKQFAVAHRLAPAQVALAWLLYQKPFIVPIPGTKTETRLQENMSAAYVELTDADYKKLDEILKEHTVIGARYSEATESMTDRS